MRLTNPMKRINLIKLTKTTKNRGFTILELLVVLVIISLIAGLVGPRIFGQADSAKVKTAETQVKMLKGALQFFRLDFGRYPTQQEGLNVLVENNVAGDDRRFWKGPYLDEALPLDPWQTAYQYSSSPSGTQDFSLYSLGADGQRGGEELNADIGYLPRQ